MLAAHGLSEVLVSDNGTVFSSNQFLEFTRRNSIRRIRTTAYHPVPNGQVEKTVRFLRMQ